MPDINYGNTVLALCCGGDHMQIQAKQNHREMTNQHMNSTEFLPSQGGLPGGGSSLPL